MILTKTSTRTDKSSSSQERLISLSTNLIFRKTPFYFVTYGPFCNLIGLQYTLQREQLNVLCASMRVWLRETRWHVNFLISGFFDSLFLADSGGEEQDDWLLG